MGYWYVYQPLKELGHEVLWYDTVNPEIKDYTKVLESFKPDLAFCCFTGDPSIAPYEPWLEVAKETESGRTKTFNWFCDDTWRFESFSSKVCRFFVACSTPEPNYLEKYHSIGYSNIILGNWHANSLYYPKIKFDDKSIDICFLGNLTPSRKLFLDDSSLPITNIYGIPTKKVFQTHSKTKIGLNFSINDNDPMRKTQMKQRIFEVPAGGGLLITEYHKGIEEFFDLDKDIVTFKTRYEFDEKVKFLLSKPKIVQTMAANGYKRFIQEHDSKIRIGKVLNGIQEF
jgi:spore maturation protein CgeB